MEVVALDGLLIDFCRARNIAFMLRGLRAVSDFDSELQMANMNRKMAPEVDTILMTDDANFYVSSSLVREIASLGGEIRQFVPACVELGIACQARPMRGPVSRRADRASASPTLAISSQAKPSRGVLTM